MQYPGDVSMKVESYAAIKDCSVEAVVEDIKAGRVRGYESGGQWYVLPPLEEQESKCLKHYEESRSLADGGSWEAAYRSASKGLELALEYLLATSR